MNSQLFAIAVLISVRLMWTGSLVAVDAPIPSIDNATKSDHSSTFPTAKDDQPQETEPNNKEKQFQLAAWLLDSKKIANEYVDAIDKKLYLQSWTKRDLIFQHAITKEEWTKALNRNRKPLGHVISRKLKDQRLTMDPQGLPKGAYMVVEYETSFDRTSLCRELLTLRQGSDGVWRVLTYQFN